jgi:hypothetical protein
MPTATAALFMATLPQDTICRLGPGENYFKMITELKGETVELKGRNEDSDWVIIHENAYDNTSPLCWIPVSALDNPGALDELGIAKYELLPLGPSAITAPNGVCGNNRPMIVEWSPVVSGVEYRLYRNGTPVSTQTGGKYYDVNMPTKRNKTVVTYTYMVQAINDYGTSPAVAVSVTVCGKGK